MITSPLFQVDQLDVVTYSMDELSVASRAGSVLSWVTRHIANIDIIETLFESSFSSLLQGCYRSRGQTLQFVKRIEACEM